MRDRAGGTGWLRVMAGGSAGAEAGAGTAGGLRSLVIHAAIVGRGGRVRAGGAVPGRGGRGGHGNRPARRLAAAVSVAAVSGRLRGLRRPGRRRVSAGPSRAQVISAVVGDAGWRARTVTRLSPLMMSTAVDLPARAAYELVARRPGDRPVPALAHRAVRRSARSGSPGPPAGDRPSRSRRSASRAGSSGCRVISAPGRLRQRRPGRCCTRSIRARWPSWRPGGCPAGPAATRRSASPAGPARTVWVGWGGSLRQVRTRTGATVRQVRLPAGLLASDIAVDPAARYLYVAGEGRLGGVTALEYAAGTGRLLATAARSPLRFSVGGAALTAVPGGVWASFRTGMLGQTVLLRQAGLGSVPLPASYLPGVPPASSQPDFYHYAMGASTDYGGALWLAQGTGGLTGCVAPGTGQVRSVATLRLLADGGELLGVRPSARQVFAAGPSGLIVITAPARCWRCGLRRSRRGQPCWKSLVSQMRSLRYCWTLATYCWAGAVCQRPANQRPTQPHRSPWAYGLAVRDRVQPGLVPVVARAPDRVGRVRVHRGRVADPRPAGRLERVPVLQDAVALRALAGLAVRAGLVTRRAGAGVRTPVPESALLPPALHRGLREHHILVDAPLARRPPQDLRRGAGEVPVDAPGEQLVRLRAVAGREEMRAHVLAGYAGCRARWRPCSRAAGFPVPIARIARPWAGRRRAAACGNRPVPFPGPRRRRAAGARPASCPGPASRCPARPGPSFPAPGSAFPVPGAPGPAFPVPAGCSGAAGAGAAGPARSRRGPSRPGLTRPRAGSGRPSRRPSRGWRPAPARCRNSEQWPALRPRQWPAGPQSRRPSGVVPRVRWSHAS